MGKRSFKELASGSVGASKAPAPPSTSSVPKTTSTPSTAPGLAPNTTTVPSTTPRPSTAPATKKSVCTPSSIVLGMPASDPKAARSSVPLVSSRSGDDARKKAKGKPQDTASADRRGSGLESVFDDDSAAARLFATLAFPDDPNTRVRASFPGTMSRAGLRFLAFVNRVGHELEAEIEKHKLRVDAYAKGELAAKTEHNKYAEQLEKRDKELEKALGDNKRLRMENDKLTKKLEAAEKDASNSLSCLTSRNTQVAELKKRVGKKREALKTPKALIVDLHEKFAIAKAKFEELKGNAQDRLVFQIQREANLDFVKQLLGLFPDRKVPKLEDELMSLIADVEAHTGDEEYFDKLMENLGECFDVVLPEFAKPPLPIQDVSLEKLAADAGVADVSGSHMFSESAGGLLQEMRIDSAGLLKDLMISEDGRMSFAGEDEAEETTIAAADTQAEKTKTVGTEKTAADVDGAEKAASNEAGEDREAHS
ncbi:hypothetical protein AALP_AA7G123400 [Arabis alpina]|uniref:Uncharacterized protein n=1 Tax=Arabis alpina TaxID=50452 RepID=A0A087GHK3_ARAAL|nr:hypothetical protein AALP_AA7G123400 [Arabis alpina]